MIASIALTPKYALSLGLMLTRGTLATNAYHARIQCHEDAVRADGGLRRRLAMAAAAATASGGDRQRQWDGGGYVTRRLVARKRVNHNEQYDQNRRDDYWHQSPAARVHHWSHDKQAKHRTAAADTG